jgi:hypothetical protein
MANRKVTENPAGNVKPKMARGTALAFPDENTHQRFTECVETAKIEEYTWHNHRHTSVRGWPCLELRSWRFKKPLDTSRSDGSVVLASLSSPHCIGC